MSWVSVIYVDRGICPPAFRESHSAISPELTTLKVLAGFILFWTMLVELGHFQQGSL